MNNQASSFRASAATPRWYAQRWPWLLFGGPGIVVVASLSSAWLAVKSDDGLVATDYYKQGLLINRKLRQEAARVIEEPRATLTFTAGQRVSVRLDGIAKPPEGLRLSVGRPGDHVPTSSIELVKSADDGSAWTGTVPPFASGRLIVKLSSERWQLPITTLLAPLSVVRLGATDVRG